MITLEGLFIIQEWCRTTSKKSLDCSKKKQPESHWYFEYSKNLLNRKTVKKLELQQLEKGEGIVELLNILVNDQSQDSSVKTSYQ